MNRFIYRSFAIVSFFGILNSCQKENKTHQEPQSVEQVNDATLFILDTSVSNIDWTGYKIFKSENTSHFGTIKFSEGEIGVKNQQIVSGKFVANTTTLANTDLIDNKDASEKLNQHLKSPDFFDVEKYPTATFEITKVMPNEQGDYNSVLEGNLTIKGISKFVKFNANVKLEDQQVSISTEPTDIDRSLFGVNFQSPIENGVIKNEITLQIMVKTNLKK